MVARQLKTRANRRKLHFPTNLTDFKLSHSEKCAMIREALVYISLLKLKIEAAEKEYKHLKMVKRETLNHSEEVKVEKIEERFHVKVRCAKGRQMLVKVLEAFDEMGLNVIHARVLCQDSFSMEAIVVPQEHESKVCNVDDITKNLVKALGA